MPIEWAYFRPDPSGWTVPLSSIFLGSIFAQVTKAWCIHWGFSHWKMKDDNWQLISNFFITPFSILVQAVCAIGNCRLLIASYFMWRRWNFKGLSQAKRRTKFSENLRASLFNKNFLNESNFDSTFKRYGSFTLLFAMKNDPVPLAHKFTRHLAKKQRWNEKFSHITSGRALGNLRDMWRTVPSPREENKKKDETEKAERQWGFSELL